MSRLAIDSAKRWKVYANKGEWRSGKCLERFVTLSEAREFVRKNNLKEAQIVWD